MNASIAASSSSITSNVTLQKKQMGLQDACKALNTHIHPNMSATQETPLTPERGASVSSKLTKRLHL
ncbi:hypothetical protein ACFS07_06265 [Undibacterium arcticum]